MHTAIFNSFPGCKVTAVVDPAWFPAKPLNMLNPNITVYKDITKMFKKERIHGVLIASPVGHHIDNALECVKNDVPFLMEKPLSLNAAQAKPLIEELGKKPLPNMIGYMARNIDSFREGKKIVSSGALGRILNVRGTVYVSQLFKQGNGWRYNPKLSGGGVLVSQGSHLLDLLYWYFGKIKQVNAQTFSYYSKEIEDFCHVMFRIR